MTDNNDRQDRSSYLKTYYVENKEKLSKVKKDRYHSDPEFRERAKENAKKYRKRKKEERELAIAEGRLMPVARKKGPRRPVSAVINGVVHEAYSITVAAKKIRRSVETMNYWTKMKLLPETPLRRGGERLYTSGMVLVLKLALAKRVKISLKDTGFYEEIRSGWVDAGVYETPVEIMKR